MATQFPPPEHKFIKARNQGGSQTPKAIVLHGTVSSDDRGTARNIANWWAGPTSPMSSCHYVVDPGEVIQCVGDHRVAYHCGYNTGSIGVEFCDEQTGPATRWRDDDSLAILRRAARLVAELCLAYDIVPVRPSTEELRRKGPHGIYGHNDSRLAFGNTTHTDPRDFPWELFLGLVRREIKKIRRAAQVAIPDSRVRLNVAHTSLQFSDTKAQQRADLEKLFARAKKRGLAWFTGTEAAPGKSNDNDVLLAEIAPKYGYRYTRRIGDSWIAVAEDFIDGDWKVSSVPVLPGLAGKYAPKAVLVVEFRNKHLGDIVILACHYLTKGRPGAKDPAYRRNAEKNRALARAIGELAREKGRGNALVFYGGDQNIVDRDEDTFMGEPLTSTWDELEKWENTGHGNIDVIASYDKDGRVSAAYVRALDDKEFPLHSDHFLVETGFDVEPL